MMMMRLLAVIRFYGWAVIAFLIEIAKIADIEAIEIISIIYIVSIQAISVKPINRTTA